MGCNVRQINVKVTVRHSFWASCVHFAQQVVQKEAASNGIVTQNQLKDRLELLPRLIEFHLEIFSLRTQNFIVNLTVVKKIRTLQYRHLPRRNSMNVWQFIFIRNTRKERLKHLLILDFLLVKTLIFLRNLIWLRIFLFH